jgi:hypothetical protein
MTDIFKSILDFFKNIVSEIGGVLGPLFDGKSGGANTAAEGASYIVLYVVAGLLVFGLSVLLLMKLFGGNKSNTPANSIIIPFGN